MSPPPPVEWQFVKAVRRRTIAKLTRSAPYTLAISSAESTAFGQASGRTIIGGRILLGNPADFPVTIKLEGYRIVAPSRGFPGGVITGANLAFTTDAYG